MGAWRSGSATGFSGGGGSPTIGSGFPVVQQPEEEEGKLRLQAIDYHEPTTELDRATTPKKKEFLTTSPARRLTDLRVPIQSLSHSQPKN
jgi:hypothetical protein